jgi:hypothetical protein
MVHKREVIKNVRDDNVIVPSKGSKALSLYTLDHSTGIEDIDLDLGILSSQNLEEIENGINKFNIAEDLIALAQGLAILHIENDRLYIQAGFDTSAKYFRSAESRLHMKRATIGQRRETAKAYLQYKDKLANFGLTGHVSKLRYLPKAAALHGDSAAIKEFKTMSARNYIEYAIVRKESNDVDKLPKIDVQFKNNSILINGRSVATFNPKLPQAERERLSEVLTAVYQCLAAGLIPHVTGYYDRAEIIGADNDLKKRRASK